MSDFVRWSSWLRGACTCGASARWGAVGALLLALVLMCPGCGGERAEEEGVRPIRAMRVGDLSEFRGRQFPGRAEAVQFAELSFRVPGSLRSMPARLGLVFEEGVAVAELDRRDFEVRVRRAEASLARARSEFVRAEAEFQRAAEVFDQGAVSEIEIVRLREAMNIASATVEAMEAELQASRDDLADTTLRAPFTGEISARYTENFEDVQARQRVVRIVDDSRIRFTVFVPEQFMVLLPSVEEILCEFDAFPGRELPAVVDEIGREADQITRTFPVTLVMDQPAGARVLSGMTGRAWVERLRVPEGVAEEFDVPPGAIGESAEGRRFVWVFDEQRGVVNRREVEVGRLSPSGVRVQGVRRGEIVATAGAAFLREGQRVRLLDEAIGRGAAREGGAPE